MAALLSVARAVAPSIINGYAHYAQAKLSSPATAVFVFSANLSHAIVEAAMVFTGFAPAHQGWTAVVRWLAVSTAGSLAGGVTLVTVFRLIQAHQRQRG